LYYEKKSIFGVDMDESGKKRGMDQTPYLHIFH